jgi:glycosyltransferase involved in cell wall biosynthesis
MKILILSSPNPTKTAGVVAADIYYGLKKIAGNDVKMLVKAWEEYDDKNIITCESRFDTFKNLITNKIKHRLSKYGAIKLHKTNPDYHVQDYDQTVTYYSSKKMIKKVGFVPDVILVLFMQNFLSYKNLHELGKITGAKTYQLLMDMAPYTGICHYAWDCTGYTKQCGKCPALYSNDPNDQSHINWAFKKQYIEQTNIDVIAVAEWQLRQVHMSSLYANKKVHKMFLATDSTVFKPGDKGRLRAEWGIGADRKVIYFGSVGLDHKRKGMFYLLESLKILKQQVKDTPLENDILLLIAGKGIESITGSLEFEHKSLGMLHDSKSLAMAYQVADVFICPSIEDAGPTMINQSVMCGTPVVAFEMGVALDLVKTGETGYRAVLRDSTDMAKGINYILSLNKDDYNKMSVNCRQLAMENYDIDVMSGKLFGLIQNPEA